MKDSHGALQGLIITPPPSSRKFHPSFCPGVLATGVGVSKVAAHPDPLGRCFSHFSVLRLFGVSQPSWRGAAPRGPLSQQVPVRPEISVLTSSPVMWMLLVWGPLLCDTDLGHLLRDRGGCLLAAH